MSGRIFGWFRATFGNETVQETPRYPEDDYDSIWRDTEDHEFPDTDWADTTIINED